MGILTQAINSWSAKNIGTAPDVPLYPQQGSYIQEEQFRKPKIREEARRLVPIIEDVRPLRVEEACAYKSVLAYDDTPVEGAKPSWEEFRQRYEQNGEFEQEQQYDSHRPVVDKYPAPPFTQTMATTPKFKIAGGRKYIDTELKASKVQGVQGQRYVPTQAQGGPRNAKQADQLIQKDINASNEVTRRENSHYAPVSLADSLYNLF